MKTRNLFMMYLLLASVGSVVTQALPVVYKSYGFTNTQIYNLISIVFLATIFQPIIGFIIDRFFPQKMGISLLISITAVISIFLISINTYVGILIGILTLSIFRIPLFPIMDGYTTTLAHKFNLNMGLIRSGAMLGYGAGVLVLVIFLNIFGLGANFSFLFMAIMLFLAIVIINYRKDEEEVVETDEEKVSTTENGAQTTVWSVFILLIILQTTFFGFSILKFNYTTPFLMEQGYSNAVIALSTFVGIFPLFILMPMFGKIFKKFKYTTIILFCILLNIFQTILFVLFPTNLVIIMLGSFLTGFIFPLYTPTFGMFLNKALNSKFISTGFTTIFTIQNVFIFLFNQFFVIKILDITNTTISAFNIILVFFIIAIIPVVFLKLKKY